MADEPADAMRSDDAWFRELAEGAGDVVFALRLRPDLAVEYVSHGVVDQLGYEADEVIADPGLLTRCVDELDALAMPSRCNACSHPRRGRRLGSTFAGSIVTDVGSGPRAGFVLASVRTGRSSSRAPRMTSLSFARQRKRDWWRRSAIG